MAIEFLLARPETQRRLEEYFRYHGIPSTGCIIYGDSETGEKTAHVLPEFTGRTYSSYIGEEVKKIILKSEGDENIRVIFDCKEVV